MFSSRAKKTDAEAESISGPPVWTMAVHNNTTYLLNAYLAKYTGEAEESGGQHRILDVWSTPTRTLTYTKNVSRCIVGYVWQIWQTHASLDKRPSREPF
jgi:hypothetical protein